MKKSRFKFANIIKAILTRVLIMIHIHFLYLSFIWKIENFGILFMSLSVCITLIILEGIYTIFIRCGHEWKWGSPLLFIYIGFAYLPCLLESYVHDFQQSLVTNGPNNSNDTTLLINDNPFSKKSVRNAITEAFFLIVIITRWLIPKGKISLEELSRLLLIYVTSIADILDMMKMIKSLNYSDCSEEFKRRIFTMSLVCLWFSIVQLSLGLTAKRSNLNNKSLDNDFDKTKNLTDQSKICQDFKSKFIVFFSKIRNCFSFFMNKIREMFEKEVWGIFVMLILKDIPICLLRTYAYAVHYKNCILWSHSVFFTLKTYLFIIIHLNRCYIIFREEGKISNKFKNETIVGIPVINLVSQSTPASNLTPSRSTNSLNETNSTINSTKFSNLANCEQQSEKKWIFIKNQINQGAFKNVSTYS